MERSEVLEKKLAVIFPGIGYTVDKPLMYYSAKIAKNAGYEIKPIPYSSFPKKIIGDQDKMKESFEIAIRQAREMLANVDFNEYSDILFIGKSIGTAVALRIAMESGIGNQIRKVLYTPVGATFENPVGEAIAFTGTGDPWVGGADSVILELCKNNGIPCYVYEHANHSLETGELDTDLRYLKDVLEKTMQFINEGNR